MAIKMPAKSKKSVERRRGAPDETGSGKDLGNFKGFAHSRITAHFQAVRATYSTTTYDPIAAFLPSRLFEWIPQIAKYWFHKKHAFRDYTTHGKGTGIFPIDDRVKISIAGDWGTGTDEARIVAAAMEKSDPDFTIHLGDVYYVGDGNEVRENFLGEKTSPYAPTKWPMGTKGSFALNGNHEMYADGHDPFQKVVGRWLIRRLSPESNPIEIADLPEERDEERLLHAMGSEAANVHLGRERQTKNILNDLRRRKANWLRSAAKDMAKAMEREWKDYTNT